MGRLGDTEKEQNAFVLVRSKNMDCRRTIGDKVVGLAQQVHDPWTLVPSCIRGPVSFRQKHPPRVTNGYDGLTVS